MIKKTKKTANCETETKYRLESAQNNCFDDTGQVNIGKGLNTAIRI